MLFYFELLLLFCLTYVFSKNALHMFQQQRYELRRYSLWFSNKNNIHFSLILIYPIIAILFSLIFKHSLVSEIICMILVILYSYYYLKKEVQKQYIKPLVLTNRVKRQIVCLFILLLLTFILCLKVSTFALASILAIFIPYLLIYPMALITLPIEELIKKYYENDARKILDSYNNLIKIGITGSFGKTSTKNIINDIINQQFLTLITPASYNTPMGITRSIREHLKPIHEIFVCEMGADKVGDIEYLMNFVKPNMGVVTSIGPQHLNTFKTQENIIIEKMKEVEMLPSDGVAFINLDNEFIANYEIKNTCKVVSIGINNKKADYVAKDIIYSKDGSEFNVSINKKVYKFKTSLLGQHNITNILLGIAIAYELGIKVEDIVKNVSRIRQVEHRLEVKKINGLTFIDDAFNSNPVGSKMALDVLKLMPEKRVIVTPGMIDLGKRQDEINYEFGKYMKGKADLVLLVGEKQTSEIYRGLKDAKFDMDNVLVFKTVKEAFAYIYKNLSSKDSILLENDLPDAFNV